MSRKTKTGIAIVIMIILSLSLFGCTGATTEQPQQTPPADNQQTTYTVKEYYVNDNYVATGDESLQHYVTVESAVSVSASDGQDAAMLESLNKLKEVPQGMDGTTTAIGSKFYFDSVKKDGSTAVVNLTSAGGITVGDLEEKLAIGQIVSTLVNSFDGIDKVQFLADGQKTDSLLGNIDTSQPIGTADI